MYSKKVIFLFSLAFLLICSFILHTIWSREDGKAASICQTKVCHKEAKRIMSSLNTSVDPCVDFHKYSCEGWIANNVLTPDISEFSIFEVVDDRVTKRLKEMYLHSNDSEEMYSMRFVSRLYRSCVDDENGSLEPLRRLLASLGGWPLASGNKSVGDWKQMFVGISAQFGNWLYPETLLSVKVKADFKDALTYRIRLDQPKLSMGRNDFLSNDSKSENLRKAYSEYITKTARLFGAKGDITEDVEKLIQFETEIAKIKSPVGRHNYEKIYQPLNFTELRDQIPEVDWFNLIVNIYRKMGSSVRPKAEDKVDIMNMNYTKQVSSLLKTTETLVVVNYLGWRAVQNMEFVATQDLREIMIKFSRIKTGIEKPVEGWRRCLNFIQDELPDLVGRKYIDAYFTENDRNEAEKLIKHVSMAYENLIQSKDWFDPETKRKAVEKLRAVTSNVGYPLWLKNDTLLESIYNFSRTVDPRNVFQGMIHVKAFVTKTMFEELRKKVDKSRKWSAGPALVNAMYSHQQNSIIFPAAFLNIPFFSSDRPGFLNYGAIGQIVGHELTHGFDDEGSQFDKDGLLFNWWSNDTKRKFDDKAKCFIDQYSSIFVEMVNMSLNGANTVGENIADNGGLREAFDAYHLHYNDQNPDQTLPGLEKYSLDQLFFISYATTCCSLMREEKLRNKVLYSYHSPEEFRVNIPVSNFGSFGKAFDCKPGTPMNLLPEKRCILW